MTSPTRSAGAVFAFHSKKLAEPEYAAAWIAHIRSRCIVTETGCWEYQGFRHQKRGTRHLPYGSASYRGKGVRVHRKMLELKLGRALPSDMHACHTCDNPPCCNPDHLWEGPSKKNCEDMVAKGRYGYHESHYTHCKHGHEFTPENTRKCKRGFRTCLTCERANQRRYWADGRAKERQRRNKEKARARKLAMAGATPTEPASWEAPSISKVPQ